MKTIVVPTDFSKLTHPAEDTAFYLAQKLKAPIYFYHALDLSLDWENIKTSDEYKYPEIKARILDAQKHLDKLVKEAELRDIQAHKVLEYHSLADNILKFTANLPQPVIIMGSHTHVGMRGIFLGSNARKLVRSAQSPVLVVRDKLLNPHFRKIIFASNFNTNITKELDFVKEIAKLNNAQIDLVKIITPSRFETSDVSLEKMKKAHEKMEFDPCCNLHIFNDLSVEEGVLKFARLHNTDLICLDAHQTEGILDLINSNITEYLINHCEIPVLALTKTD